MKRLVLFLTLLTLFAIPAFGQSTPGTVRFPIALDDNDSLIRTADNSRTTLSSSITSGSTTITVASTSTFPATGTLVIDSEIILYTSKSGTTFTGLTRGADGTAAASHTSGVAVRAPILSLHKRTTDNMALAMQAKIGYGAATPVSNALFCGTGTNTSSWCLTPTFNGSNITNLNFTQLGGAATDAQVSDAITLTNFNQITTRSASDLSSGTLPDARFPATLPASSGANLTSLNASNISSGTLNAARLPSGTVNASGATAGAYSVFTDSDTIGNGYLKQSVNILRADGMGSSPRFNIYTNGVDGDVDTTLAQIYADANVVILGAEGEGSFAAQATAIRLRALNAGEIQFYQNNTAFWRIPATGHLLPDGTRNIGASGTPVNTAYANQVRLTPVAFASLPTPAEGMMAWVTDSNTATWGATIAGGGANKVLAVYNGTNWTVAGK